MSRWAQTFEEAEIREKIYRLHKYAKDIKPLDPSRPQEVTELARLKKIILFIKKSIDSVDPDLMPLSIITSAANNINSAISALDSYSKQPNISLIQSANNFMDELIAQLKPYHPLSHGSAAAAGRAFSEYAKVVNESISGFSDELNKIHKFYGEIFDEENGIKIKIDNYKNNIELIHGELNKLYDYFFEEEDESGSVRSDIAREEYSNIINIKSNIEDIQNDLENKIEKLNKEFKLIFGYDITKKNEDGSSEKEHITGETEKFRNLIREIEDFKIKQKENYNALIKEIESLLPGATSAGLATAFKNNKDSFNDRIKNNSYLFFASVVMIFIISVTFIFNPITGEFYNIEYKNLNDTIYRFMIRFSMAIPFIWLAIVASKRRNQAERLQQEYAHKEAISASYENFRLQIENLNRNRDDLLEKLMEKVINSIAWNAANTLDKKHADVPPFLKTAESLCEKAGELAVDAADKIIKKKGLQIK